ncbi:Cyb5 protein [Martiniozyma asiatica (nom. inval.)]|nr:Cyb5 protein [Martiniozyma asiatica]
MTQVYTAAQVAEHNTRDDIWIIYNGKVYDVTEYLDEHPGGEEVIIDCAGGDATEAFDDIGHSEDAQEMLEGMLIGKLEGGVLPKKSAAKPESGSNVGLIVAGLIAVVAVAYFAMK